MQGGLVELLGIQGAEHGDRQKRPTFGGGTLGKALEHRSSHEPLEGGYRRPGREGWLRLQREKPLIMDIKGTRRMHQSMGTNGIQDRLPGRKAAWGRGGFGVTTICTRGEFT